MKSQNSEHIPMSINLDLFETSDVSNAAVIDLPNFPTTRYQGSKRKIISPMAAAFSNIQFDTALDLFSGSGTVSLLLRHLGKRTDSNDYLLFNKSIAELFLSATDDQLRSLSPTKELRDLLHHRENSTRSLVEDNYSGIFFTDEENRQIDQFSQNAEKISKFSALVYRYAVGQALMKKRPYNLFHRANLGMRLKNVKRSFGNAVTWEKSIEHHATKAVQELMLFPFGNLQSNGISFSENATDLSKLSSAYDLIYVDPPYLNGKGLETNYSNFYGFLNGLCEYDLFESGDSKYPHKPLLGADSGWKSEASALSQIQGIAKRWPNSIIFFSYRSDGVPSGAALCEALSVGGRRAEVHSFGEFKYALSRTDTNEELYVLSYP
jgi:adenine-specific DNA-methyltransferase